MRQKATRVLYIGVIRHGFLWLKFDRCWVVEVRCKAEADSDGVFPPNQFYWEQVGRFYNHKDAIAEANRWEKNNVVH